MTTTKLSLTAAQITTLGKFIANGATGITMQYVAKVLPNEVFIAYVKAHTDIIAQLDAIDADETEKQIALTTCKQLNDVGSELIWQKHREVEQSFWALAHIYAHAKARMSTRENFVNAAHYIGDVNAEALKITVAFEAPFLELYNSVRVLSLPVVLGQPHMVSPMMEAVERNDDGSAKLYPRHFKPTLTEAEWIHQAFLKTQTYSIPKDAPPTSEEIRSNMHFGVNDVHGPAPALGVLLNQALLRKMPDRRSEMSDTADHRKRPTYREASRNLGLGELRSVVRGTCKNAIVIYDDYIVDYAAHGSLIAIQNLVASMIKNGISLDAFDPSKFYPSHWEMISVEYQEKSN